MIGEYALDFKINLNITTTTAAATDTNSTAGGNSTLAAGNSTGSSHTEVLAITPAQPFQRNSGRRVSAKLLGDLEAYQQAPQLDGKYLMIPTPAGRLRCLAAHPSARLPACTSACLPACPSNRLTTRLPAFMQGRGRRSPTPAASMSGWWLTQARSPPLAWSVIR
jgi:hypothetical protein